jgi:PAS domain S-box-containing protein
MSSSGPNLGWLELGQGWLFEHIRDAVAVVELSDSTIRLWNPAAERLLGFAVGDVLGTRIEQLLPDIALRRAQPGVPIELSGRHASGASIPLEAVVSHIETPHTYPRFAVLVIRDISHRRQVQAAEREIAQRRKTERALLQAEDRLQRALARQRFLDEASSELAGSLDFDTTLHSMARLPIPRLADLAAVYALSDELVIEGVATSHIDGTQELQLDELRQHIGEQLTYAARLDRAQVVDDIDGHSWSDLPGGTVALANLGLTRALLVPLHARDRILGVMLLGAVGDTSWPAEAIAEAEDLARRCALALDNARLYRAAQEAIAARDQFLSIASHELRAPLARLKSHAEVLLLAHSQDQLDDERLAWSVQRINAAVDRLAVLTKDVLDLSRLRGGHFPFRPKPIDLANLVRDLAPRFADSIGERHQLVVELTDAACPVLVDQDRVEQLLSNLLDNASKYSPRGGDIVLAVHAADDGVLLSVRDHGLGLPTGSSNVIFEAFGRVSNAEQWNVPGMGLGLHICRVIVERHGGRIWADSDGEDRGTTLWLWLPFAAESPMSAGDVKERLANQLTLAVGYCELLATSPELPATLRAQALGAMHGAQGAAATLESF